VALVFLVLITLLGLTASSTSILQERMTGGLRNGQMGLMAAETAARGAEAWLWNLSNINGKINCGYNGGSTGFCFTPQTISDGTDSSGNPITAYGINPLVDGFRTTPYWKEFSQSKDTGVVATYATALNSSSLGTARLAHTPQYILESRGLVLPPGALSNGQAGAQGRDNQTGRNAGNQALYSYRITSRATGGNEGAVSVVETTFGAGVPSN
jgi:type IV pilus assembly protein PilX